MKLLACSLLVTLSGFAQITPIAHGAASGNPTASLTMNVSTAGATLIVMSSASTGGTNSCTGTVSDTVGGSATGNIWNHLTLQASTTATDCLWYSFSSTGGAPLVVGATHVISHNLGTFISIAAKAYGATQGGATNPFDVEAGANTGAGSAASLATGSITPTSNCELVFSGASLRSSTTYTSSPLTIIDTIDWISATREGVGSADQIQTTATAVNNTWGMAGAGQMAVTIASFRALSCASSGWKPWTVNLILP